MIKKIRSITLGSKIFKGFTLLEVLVGVAIFVVISLVATQFVAVSVRNVRKNDNAIAVRQSLDFALGAIERNLRNAKSITCPNPSSLEINYVDQNGTASFYRCSYAGAGPIYSLASGSATLVQPNLTTCSFQCTQNSGGPPSVAIVLGGTDISSGQSSKVTVSTRVTLRNY